MSLERAGLAALLALPGALAIYFGFVGGGFFPATVAVGVVVVALTLVVRTTSAEHPFAGLSPALGVAAGALGLLAAWVLVSQEWSHAPARSAVEFDRVLLYLLTLVLFGSIGRTTDRMRWAVRVIAIAIGVICVAGLFSRLFPDVFLVDFDVASDSRLNFPVTYWNTLGLIAALGLVFSLHISSAPDEPRVARVVAAALVPALLVTLYFTFSRGGLLAAVIGVGAYLLLVRSAAVVAALAAIVPPAAVAGVVAYNADALSSTAPVAPRAVSQGHRVAIVLGSCIVAAAALRWLMTVWEDRRRPIEMTPALIRLRRVVAVGLPVGAVAVFLALSGPHWVSGQWDRFISGDRTHLKNGDLRTRLTDVTNNGRTDIWNVALKSFDAAPLHGAGAGTFQLEWERRRPVTNFIRDAHSLYLETMGELGIVGLVLLLTCLLTILGAALHRFRVTRRPVYAAAFAALLAWAIRAGADWDWEMPSVTLWVFALGGLILASERRNESDIWPWPGRTARLAMSLAWLGAAVFAATIAISEGHLHNSRNDLIAGRCPAASDKALDALASVPDQGRAYEFVAFCDMGARDTPAALSAISKAIEADPNNWQYRFDLALARAQNGQDPSAALAKAHSLNPREPMVKQLADAVRGNRPPGCARRRGTRAGSW